MKKVVHFEVHFVILYSKTELLSSIPMLLFYVFSYFFFTISNVCLYNVKEWSVIYDGLFKRASK